MQTTIQQILVTLHNLDAQIHLKLPASPRSVHQQRLHLQQIQQQLATLQDEVIERSQACITPSAYLSYLR